MKIGTKFLLATLTFLGSLSMVHSADSAPASSIQAMVLDDTGEKVANAKVYVYSNDRKEFFGVYEGAAALTLSLPPGRYRVYAAKTLMQGGFYEHYMSPEATLSVSSGEIASVILAMQRTEASEMIVSDTVLEKISLDSELVKYIN
jgi:hypothetical protein